MAARWREISSRTRRAGLLRSRGYISGNRARRGRCLHQVGGRCVKLMQDDGDLYMEEGYDSTRRQGRVNT